MIGVIGGMGPLATADFVQKVISATSAEHDEQHVPMLISNDPRIPRRPAAILQGAQSPLPRLMEIRDNLIHAGATALVMPCNTAHYWHADLMQGCRLPFPSIIELTCDQVTTKAADGGLVGLVATEATLATGLFQTALERRGLSSLVPTDQIVREFMLPSIAYVKSGQLAKAAPLMQATVHHLLENNAKTVILACTEAPIAMSGVPDFMDKHCVDSTDALARATVDLWGQIKQL